jgi:hypothetical protein
MNLKGSDGSQPEGCVALAGSCWCRKWHPTDARIRGMHEPDPHPRRKTTDRRPCAQRTTAACAAITLVVSAALPGAAVAQESWFPAGDKIRIAYTPKAFHFVTDSDYVDWNNIVALEWVTPRHTFWDANRTHFGISVFNNSYGQPSQAIYAGLEWDWTSALGGDVFLSLSAGLVHGYKEPWEDKLPLNSALGVGVTLVPSITWQRSGIGITATLTGSAIAVRYSYTFNP